MALGKGEGNRHTHAHTHRQRDTHVPTHILTVLTHVLSCVLKHHVKLQQLSPTSPPLHVLLTVCRQISKLTEEVNHLSAQVDTAYEENEVLRNRLGLSAGEEVDLSHLRHRKNVEIEQLRALNRELDKQVLTPRPSSACLPSQLDTA